MDNNGGSHSTTTLWCHPASQMYRGLALLLMCFLCFGLSFCYDSPAALADNFKADTNLNTSQYALLYAIYSWPNVIMCFIGGYLIDRYFGVRLGTIIFMTIVFTGAVIFALGAYVNAFWVMTLGRFVFGIGGESLSVAVNNYVVLWFKGKGLNMVFGIQMSFARFGSTVNFWVMEHISNWVANYYVGYQKLGVTLFIASLTCLGSLVCGLVLSWMDYRAEKILQRRHEGANDRPFQLRDICHFKSVFWLVTAVCVMYYLAVYPFTALGKLFFERKFAFSPQEANQINSLSNLLSAFLSPFCGLLIDKTGRNLSWVIGGIVTTVVSHILLAFTFYNPYIGVMLIGIANTLIGSALWPLIALIVPEQQLGTAYGISQAFQNLGLASVTILAGIIVDKFGYLMLEMLFLNCLFISLLAAVMVYMVDSVNNGVLNLSPSKRVFMKLDYSAINQDDTSNLFQNEVNADLEDEQGRNLNDSITRPCLEDIRDER